MILKNLIRKVELYVHVQGSENRYLITDFINESIEEFCRFNIWKMLLVEETIVLDGSGNYNLDTILINSFNGELGFFDESGNEIQKYNYETYIQQASKVGYWTLLGKKLYVEGDSGSNKIVFVSAGDKWRYFSIIGVNIGSSLFTISGEKSAYFSTGGIFRVYGSTGNDRYYTINNINTLSGDTEITVVETILDATADGNILVRKSELLEEDNDEILVTQYYWDIIKQMTIIKLLDYLGDEQAKREEIILARKLDALKRKENRIDKQGKLKAVIR